MNSKPLTSIDPWGLVAWKGRLGGIGVVDGVGASFLGFDLTSECKCNRVVRIKGYVSLLAVGLGFKYIGSGGAASFHDNKECPEGNIANGTAAMDAVSAVVGRGGGCSKITIGHLYSDWPVCGGPTYGVDVSVGLYLGASMVTSSEVRPCCGSN